MAGFTRRFNGGRFAASRFNGQRRGERAPEIITADTAPQLAAADDADTPADVFTAGAYSSTAGTISDVTTTYLVNGSAEASSYDLAAGDTLQVTELVTDSEGNTRTFSTGVVTVTVSVALSNTGLPEITGTATVGETLSVSHGTWVGSASRTYSYQWTRDGADISGATSSTYVLVEADDGTDVGCDVTADDGFTTVTASAVAVTIGAEAAISLASIEELYTDSTTRGQQGTPNKTVGVDALPSGASISGSTVNWSGSIDWGANGDKWDFNDYSLTIQATATGSLRNALITEPANSGWIRLIDIYAGAQIDTIEWCTFRGAGVDSDVGSIIGMRTVGTDASATAPAVAMIQRNAFFGMAYDGVKSTCGGVRRYNYFDTPVNLAYEPPVWTSGDSYDTGELATDPTGQYVFRSLVDNNTTQPPGSKTTTTEWENIDPHADQDNPYAVIGSELEIYANYFNRSNANRLEGAPGYGWGINNSIRTALNNNLADIPHLAVRIYQNVIAGGEELQSYPIQIDDGVGHANWLADEVTDNWITPNSGGLFIHPDWDNGTNVYSGTISYTQVVGPKVYAIVGQSQNERILSNATIATTDIPKPTLVAEGAVTLYTDPDGTGGLDTPNITVTEVTQANVDAGLVNPAMAALSDLLAYRAPGKQIVIADLSVPGTGFASLMDDSDPDRMYAHFKGMVDRLAADGTPIAHLLWNWMGNDAAEAKTYDLSFAPLFLGQRLSGSAFTLGTANPDSVRGDVVDHIVYDIEAPAGELGRGTFTRAGTKISFVGWPSFNPREVGDPEMINFTTTGDASFAGYSTQVDAPARQKVKDLLADARFNDMRGWHGPSCHVVRMTQDDGSGGSTLATHPDYREADGLINYAWPFGVTILRDLGDPLARNFEIASVTVSPDGTEARLQVMDTDGNALRAEDVLTTLRAHRGTAVPDPLPPHWQPVVGLEISRASTGQRRPIWNSAAGRDADFTGTVTIAGDEIVVTPSVAFANGDTIELLRGDASAVLLEDRDATARLYLDMPIVHVPELKQAGATYPMEGIPVDPHAIMTVSGVTGTPPTAQRFTLGTAAFTDPSVVPGSTSVIEYEAKLVFSSEFATAEEIFGATSDIRIEVALTGGSLLVRSARIEDSAGTVVLGLANLAEFAYSTGTVLTLNVLIDWTAQNVTVSRDGTELSVTPFTTAGNGAATITRPLNLLSYTSAATLPADTDVEYVKAWFTTSGTRTLRKEISIAAQGSVAGINADPWHSGGDVTAA